jgi:hypothetical protein
MKRKAALEALRLAIERGQRTEPLDDAQIEEHSAPVLVGEQLDLDAALMTLAPGGWSASP